MVCIGHHILNQTGFPSLVPRPLTNPKDSSLIEPEVLGLGAGPSESIHVRIGSVHDGDTIIGLDDSKTQ